MQKLGWIVAAVVLCGCSFSNSGEPIPDSALFISHVLSNGRELSFDVSHLGDYTFREFGPIEEHRGHLTNAELRDFLALLSPLTLEPLAVDNDMNCDLKTEPDAYIVLADGFKGCVRRSQITDPTAKAQLDLLIEVYEREAAELGIR
jgi:hypothetical protein